MLCQLAAWSTRFATERQVTGRAGGEWPDQAVGPLVVLAPGEENGHTRALPQGVEGVEPELPAPGLPDLVPAASRPRPPGRSNSVAPVTHQG